MSKTPAKKRRQRALLFAQQHGRCYWCGCHMVMPNPVKGQVPPLNEATLDHLDSRLSRERGTFPGQGRHVAACRQCNEQRASQEVASLSLLELWSRSGRAPSQRQ